jgi:hypothetical protein
MNAQYVKKAISAVAQNLRVFHKKDQIKVKSPDIACVWGPTPPTPILE